MRMSPIWTFSDPRIERFMKWLMGRTDVGDAFQRLDELTQETRTTVAKHSAVIHGIKNGASRSAHLLTYSALRTFLLCFSTTAARERLRSWLSPPIWRLQILRQITTWLVVPIMTALPVCDVVHPQHFIQRMEIK